MEGNEHVCDICTKALSRKQRLISHRQTVHGIQPNYEPKKYKQYHNHPDVPIPARTIYRHKAKLKSSSSDSTDVSVMSVPTTYSLVRHGAMTEENFNMDTESEDMDTTGQDALKEQDLQDSCDMNVTDYAIKEVENDVPVIGAFSFIHTSGDIPSTSDNCHLDCFRVDSSTHTGTSSITDTPEPLNRLEASVTCSFPKDDAQVLDSLSDSESCSYYLSSDDESNISCDYAIDSSSDENTENETEFSRSSNEFACSAMSETSLWEYDEKYMALMAYIMKHHLSGNASGDLLSMIKLFCPQQMIPKNLSVEKLKETIGACGAEIIHFCEKCYTIFPSDESVVVCTQNGCVGLRYKGPLSKQHLRQKKSFFTCLCVGQQIKDILERDGVWSSINAYRSKCNETEGITDILNADIYKDFQKPGSFLDDKNNISLLFNTDGIPLYRSSSVSIWPVYLVINELPPTMRFSRKNMILWGVWQSHGKPYFHTFFQPFIKHMTDLKENGLLWKYKQEKMCTKAILLAGTMDLQAKAYLLEMTMHNGQHGCLTCEIPGRVVKRGRGHSRIYPFVDSTAQVQNTTRTTTGILHCGLKAVENGKVEMGIKGVSPLFGMKWFDIVYGIVPDYMHGILLGITKKLLALWFSPSSSSEPYFVGKHIKSVDKILCRMRPNDMILRLPRKLESHRSHLKASELQMWLLFYCIPCLKNVLPEIYLDHLALLVEGIYILLSDKITKQKMQHADYVLTEFYCQFADLYGIENCTLNLHNAGLHLAQYVRKLGPLWAWSCFSFEDMNGSILQSVHGTGDVCLQILWIIQAQKRLSLCAPRIQNADVQKLVFDLTSTMNVRSVKTKHDAINCKIAGGMSTVTEEEVPKQKVCDLLETPGELGKLSKVLRVVCGDTVFFSEQYTRMVKRIGHVVLTSEGNGMEILTICYFLLHHNSNKCMAVVRPFTIDKKSPLVHPLINHLICVKDSEQEENVIWVEKIREKLLFLNGNKNTSGVARLPNLFGLCT